MTTNMKNTKRQSNDKSEIQMNLRRGKKDSQERFVADLSNNHFHPPINALII